MTDGLKVLVSIVNWNNSADTNRCLAGIAKMPEPEQPDVIVVDNHSMSDEFSISPVIKNNLHSLKVFKNVKNLGFAGGHNQNIRLAKKTGYDYIILLNNDTEIIDSQVFAKLAHELEARAKALGANPTIFSSLEPKRVWYGGGRLSRMFGSVRHLGVGRQKPPASNVQRVSFVTGGCLAIALQRAGLKQLLLDESYFLYWEDADWSARALKAGFELIYVPDAQLLHKVSSGLGLRSPAYIYYNIRNNYIFIRRNLRPRFWLFAWFRVGIIIAKYTANICFRYKQGRWPALKALWAGWLDGWLGKAGQTRPIT